MLQRVKCKILFALSVHANVVKLEYTVSLYDLFTDVWGGGGCMFNYISFKFRVNLFRARMRTGNGSFFSETINTYCTIYLTRHGH